MTVIFTLNGQEVTYHGPGSARLLDVLRDEFGLTGTKEGCGKGECGACSVLLDDSVVNSCLILVSQVHKRVIVTIEGLEKDGILDPVQQAFIDEGAVQCGFCIPGMILSVKSLLKDTPQPTEDDIKKGLAGNLCRCTGYHKIIAAVQRAAGQEDRQHE
jgi:aerobic-type carbon monoxide dehydrogenase small subunit (CoxS/CutS family)